jgi:XTP/dITP diphosphohydrolase
VASDQPWVLATRSAGKLRELRALFAGAGVRVVDLAEAGAPESDGEEGIECFETFEENALAKARWFAARLPGRTVVADDSGLAVRALGGEPGVRSKRWSGRTGLSGAALDAANNALLVRRLAGLADRRAQFVCAAAWVRGGVEVVTVGAVDGEIAAAGSGAEGFGYDPYFRVAELGMTLGEATVAEKEQVSHRARAFRALLARLSADGLIG